MVDVLGDAIYDLLFLLLVGTEYAVPDNKGGAIILVDVFFLRTMVYTMVRRRRQLIFYPRMELANVFSVDPELKENRDLVRKENDDRMKAHQGYGKKEKDLDVLYPAQPERDRQIKMFT